MDDQEKIHSTMKTFTIEQIRKYIKSKDSIGDVLYFLSEKNIESASEKPDIEASEDKEEEEVYCSECGEDEDIAYIAQYASGDYWKCNTCNHEFHFNIKK